MRGRESVRRRYAGRLALLLALTAVLLLVASAAGIVAFATGTAPSLGTAAASTGRPRAPTTTTTTTTMPATAVPLQVSSTTPVAGASAISPVADITVQFSKPLGNDAPQPQLAPNVPGSWRRSGPSVLVFTPRAYYTPLSSLTLTVPDGRLVREGAFGQWLAEPYRAVFTVRPAPVLRLQQLLAELGYLPVRFEREASSAPLPGPHQVGAGRSTTVLRPGIDLESRTADTVALSAQPGYFSWRYPDLPARLSSLWQPGVYTAMLEGAVMAFQADEGLEDDGVPDGTFWSDLLAAVAARRVSNAPYDYLEVSTNLPETLSVWRNGRIIYSSPANTGIPEAPTALGTYPVYARYLTVTMSGFNPDGTHYSDPGVPWVAYFNGGDAVHGFLRASYGFPQSLGCVELPYSSAVVVFNYDPIGTLVTVY